MKSWNEEKAWKIFALVCVLILILSTLPLYAISFYNHPYYDDYGFSAPVHKAWKETGEIGAVLSAAWAGARNTRQSWQGNYTGTLLSNLQPGLFSESWYWIGNFVLLTALIACFVYFFRTVFAKLGLSAWANTSLSCLILTLMIQLMPDVGEAFYWFNGGVGNVFVYSLLALAATLCIRLYDCCGRGNGLTAALAALAVLLGGGSYSGGLFALCMCAVLLVKLFGISHGKRWRFLGLTALLAICFVYSMSAPGNAVRASYINYETSAVKTILQSMYYGVGQLGGYITLPVIAVTLVMLPALYEAAQKSAYSFAHPWLVFGLGVCLYCTQFAPPLYSIASIGAGRIVNTYFISFLVFWFLYAYYLLGFLIRRGLQLPKMNLRQQGALLLTGLCLLGIGGLGFKRSDDPLYGLQNLSGPSALVSIVTGEAAQYDREMEERELLLNDDSLPEVTLSPLTAVPAVFMDDLIIPNAVYDVRPALRNYYSKDVIHIAGEEEMP